MDLDEFLWCLRFTWLRYHKRESMVENEAIVGASRSPIHSGAFTPPTTQPSDKTQKPSQMTSECLFHTFPLKNEHIFSIGAVYTADKVSLSLIVSRCGLVWWPIDNSPCPTTKPSLFITKSKEYYSITSHSYFKWILAYSRRAKTSSIPFATVDVSSVARLHRDSRHSYHQQNLHILLRDFKTNYSLIVSAEWIHFKGCIYLICSYGPLSFYFSWKSVFVVISHVTNTTSTKAMKMTTPLNSRHTRCHSNCFLLSCNCLYHQIYHHKI